MMFSDDVELLFSKYDLGSAFDAQRKRLDTDIESHNADDLLNTPIAQLVEYFVPKHSIEVPILRETEISTEQAEVHLDPRRLPDMMVFPGESPRPVPGTQISFFVPFDGDASVFMCRPSTFTTSPPRAAIRGSELVILHKGRDLKTEQVRAGFDRTLADIKQWLGWAKAGADAFNNELRQRAQQRIEGRRQKLQQSHAVVASLGFPVRRREGAPTTYAPADVPRRVPLPPKPTPKDTGGLDPALPDAEYEHILKVMRNMAMVLERSPSSFAGMEEEDLRQHFLVQLNGQYEGQAMGEAFNFEGKTDILMRAQGRNIFVAECKFWSGPDAFTATIDQLRDRYLTWRDTKAAVVVFNRNKNFTAVKESMAKAVQSHAAFKRMVDCPQEDAVRAVFSHRDDHQRNITITVLAFEVPVPTRAPAPAAAPPMDAPAMAKLAPADTTPEVKPTRQRGRNKSN